MSSRSEDAGEPNGSPGKWPGPVPTVGEECGCDEREVAVVVGFDMNGGRETAAGAGAAAGALDVDGPGWSPRPAQTELELEGGCELVVLVAVVVVVLSAPPDLLALPFPLFDFPMGGFPAAGNSAGVGWCSRCEVEVLVALLDVEVEVLPAALAKPAPRASDDTLRCCMEVED